MASLDLKNIYKVYPNGTKAVNDFTMEIGDKEFVVFVGPSGCGKSTVLRMIAGLEEITAGELKIDEAVVNDVDCKNRDTAMVFQNYALYPHMTVADNMAFPLKMAKPTKAQKAALKKRIDCKYPPVRSKKYFYHAAKTEYALAMHKKEAALSSAELEKAAEEGKALYAAYLKERAQNAETRKTYRAEKKIVLTAEDRAEIKRELSEVFPRSVRNFLLRPLHRFTLRREFIAGLREEKDLKRPISLLHNLFRPIYASRVKKEEMYTRVVEIADILGLKEYLGVKPGDMSGGQRQRVALGRAMVRDPKVFLLDEPLSNLDAKLRTQMRSEITKLHNRLQTTFIYVTHDQVEAMTMGDRIVVMKKGTIQQIDTPIDLYAYPKNLFVAGFIGTPSMNFFEAVVTCEKERACVLFAGGKKLYFSAEHLKKFERKYLGKKVTFGVRPEHLFLLEDGIECIVLGVEMLGSETLLYCDFDTESKANYENGTYPFIVKTAGVCPHRSGEIVKVGIDFANAHYFDVDTEVSVMDRFVGYNDIPVTVKEGKMIVGGVSAPLPPALQGAEGDFDAVFPTSAVKKGSDYPATPLEQETLKEGLLVRLGVGTQKLYALGDLSEAGGVNIDWHTVSLLRGGEVVLPALNTQNALSVTLRKEKLTKQAQRALPAEEARDIDVRVECGEVSLVCPFGVLKRLLGASDRKLFGVELTLLFGEEAITEGGLRAKILERFDYGEKQYARCEFLGTQIVLPYRGEQEEISFGIDLNAASIYDSAHGIKFA